MINNIKQTRGIRGATTVANNLPEEIVAATRELLERIMENNSIDTRDIAAIFFSATPDLSGAFPAKAARDMGWLDVPLFCMVEIDVPESLAKCIRIMMLVNTTWKQADIKHVYLKETIRLREQ